MSRRRQSINDDDEVEVSAPSTPPIVPRVPQTLSRQQRLGWVTRIDKTRERGFGFIRDHETGTEVFLHCTACQPTTLFEELQEGDSVGYIDVLSEKGRKAVGVVRREATEQEIIDHAAKEDQYGNQQAFRRRPADKPAAE